MGDAILLEDEPEGAHTDLVPFFDPNFSYNWLAVHKGPIVAVEILEAEPERRARLAENADLLATGIRALGFSVPEPVTPIQSVVMGEEAKAMSLCEQLLLRGIYAQGIRPPTVPPETSRIRFSLMATHTDEDIREALDALSSSLAALGSASLRRAGE